MIFASHSNSKFINQIRKYYASFAYLEFKTKGLKYVQRVYNTEFIDRVE